MSLIIKGMDMPNNCCQCKLARYDDYENETFCPFTEVMCLSIGRQDNCPLEEVQETHDKRTETHSCDLIERQAAIATAISGRIRTLPTTEDGENWIRVSEVRESLLTLPSAQPELTEPTYEQVCLYCEKRCLSLIDNGLLKKYESAQPEPKWIPVSERLPKNYGNYLVTYRTDPWEADIGTFDPSKANSDNGAWSACDANGFYFVASKGLEVCAWMPLPEPYAERRIDESD